jgi:hypothetical protein
MMPFTGDCKVLTNLDRVGIGVVPTADSEHGGFDRSNVFADRTAFPIRIAVGVFKPIDRQERLVI